MLEILRNMGLDLTLDLTLICGESYQRMNDETARGHCWIDIQPLTETKHVM